MSNSPLSIRKKLPSSVNVSKKLSRILCLIAFFVCSNKAYTQGVLSNPIFSENFGTIANGTALSTSNTSFSFVRVGTTSTGTPPNNIIAKNPSSFTASSALIGAKGASISTVDKTGLTSFSSGVLSFKFKTPSTLTGAVMVSAVGAGASFGSANGFTGGQLSAGFQVTGTSLQVRAGGAWSSALTISTSTAYAVTIIFNNTTGSLSYGSGYTLASNKCHLWVDGTYIGEYNAATSSLAATAFRIYTSTAEFEVDDVAVYSTMPAMSSSPTILGAATTSAFTTTYGTASTAQTFTITGSNLTDSLKALASAGFEVSKDSSNFYDSVSFAQSSGSVSARLSIRMKATDSVNGSYNSKSIALKSTGATSININTPSSGNTVSAKALSITGLSAANKNYDGNSSVSVTGTPAYNGLVNGESFSVSGTVSWAFADSLVGSNKTLTRTGTFLAPSANYTVTQPILTASISALVPGTPQIGVAVAGNTQATVSFTAPSFTGGATITGYTVVADPGGITANGTASPLTITGLTNGTAYTFTVYATNSAGNSTSSAASNAVTPTSDPIAPGVPTGVSAVAGNGQATISFTAPASDGGATITSYTVTSNPGGFTLNGTSSPLTMTGLTNGTAYAFTVYATNSAGNSLQSSSSNSVIPATIPDAPSISSITLGNRQLSVNFNAPSSNGGSAITNYQYSTDGGATFTACSPAQTSSPIVIKGLNNGTSYSVVIAAINALGTSTSSNALSATPANTPGAPAITSISAGNSSLSVNFTAPSSDSGSAITNYKYSIDGGTTYVACSPSQTSSPITLNGLTNGVSYTVRLRAVNAIGDGVASASASATPILPAPVANASSSVTSTSFVANWDSVPGATSYRLDVSTNSSFLAGPKLSENFAGFTTLGGTLDRSTTLNNYTQTSGWTGTSVYENAGQIKLGTSSIAGSIITPTLDATGSNGAFTFSFDLLKYGTDNTVVQVFISTNNGTTYTQVGSDITAPSSISTQTLSITGATATTKIKIAAKSASNNRYYLDNIQITSTNTNLPAYNDLTVSGTSQNVSGLVNGTTYYYRARAYVTTNTSVNSNVIAVTTNINLPPVLTAQPNATVDSAINISFTEDSVWRNSITSIKVDGTTLPSSAYVLSNPSQITLLPSASQALQTAGNKTIVITATDYRNDTIVQSLAIGIASKLVINTQPAAPLTNGGLLSVQPKVAVTDQYGNKIITTTNISAVVGNGSWTLNGTSTVLSDSGVASFSGLAATSLGPVTGATITFSADGLTGVTSSAFNIVAPLPPVLTAATSATVDTSFAVSYPDNAKWRAAITSIKVGATALATSAYLVESGVITFSPSASTLLQTSGSKTIVVSATGFINDTLSQSLLAGAPTKLAVNTQPTAPLTNGGTLAAQPKITIQDRYGNTTTSTASVSAAADSSYWTIGGTTSVSAVNGLTTFTNLTASSAVALSSAKIIFSSPGLTSVTSGSFAITAPPPANDLCANATSITVNGAVSAGTLVAATSTTNTLTYGPTKTDVWYKFVPDVTGNDTITLTFTSATSRDIDLDVFNTATCPTTGTANFTSHGSTTTETIRAAVTAGNTYYVRVIDYGTANGGSFNIYVKGPAVPTITSSGVLNAFVSNFGTASDAQNVSVSGQNLVSSILATAPVGFELSRDGGNTYKDTVIFVQSAGNVNGNLFIRLKATALVGTYDSKNIVLTSTSASTVNITTVSSGNIVSAVVPSSPRIDTVVAGNGQVSISFMTPVSNGGSAITGYTVTSDPEGITLNGTSSPITITGLTNGTAYMFTIVATNVAGNSAPSAASSSVTPTADPVNPGIPLIGTATAGNGQATIAFTAPSSDGGSAIVSYTAVSNPGNITATVNQSESGTITVTGLTNGTAYTFTVYATNSVGNSLSSAPSNSVTPKTTASAPVINSITIGNKQLSVLFSAPTSNGGSSITNYKYSTDGGQNFTACSPAQTISPITLNGLTNGTSYDVQILAVNSVGDGVASATVSSTPATKPGAPSITAITPGNSQLSVAFTAPSSDSGSAITNYKYSINGGTSYVACNPAQTSSPIVITGLTNATTYTVKILAVNAMGDGTASASMTGVPRKAEPTSQPTSLVLSSITTTSMNLSFTAAAGAPDGYLVVRSTNDTLSALPSDTAVYSVGASLGGGIVVASGATTSAVANTSLTSGTKYNYFVFAYNNASTLRDYLTSNPLTGNAITLSATPVPSASNTSTFSFDLSWPAVTGASAYVLSVSTNSGFTSLVAGYDSVNTTELTQSIAGLQAGTTYYFRLKAINASGSSAYGTGNTTTLALTAPVANAATSISASSFIANWDSVAGATSYRLDVSKSPTFGTIANVTLSENLESGMPTSYPTTQTNYTLPSGSWSMLNVMRNSTVANVASGTYSAQIKKDATANITSPSLNNVGSVSFSCIAGTSATGGLKVQKSVNGGSFVDVQTFTIGTANSRYTCTVNDSSNNVVIKFISTAAQTLYLDSIKIAYSNVVPSFVAGYQNLSVNGRSQLVPGLRNATNYYYRVRAYSTSNTSSNSNTISVLTDSSILQSPVLVADTTATVDTAFNVSFTEDPNWRDALTSITINGVSIADSAYSKTTEGLITFTPALSQLLQTPGTKTLVFLASGYTNDTLLQTIKAGIPNKLAITVQPTAPAVNGGVLAVQPKVSVRDQYGNATTSTVTVTATVGFGAWTLNGTTSVAASAGLVTFSGLTASSAGPVTGANINFSAEGLMGISTNTFNLPAPPPPVLIAAVGANVDTAFNVTFADNSRWRDSITSIKVGASTLSNTAYTIASGSIMFSPSASALLQTSGSKTIVVISTGYKNDTLTQAIAAGVATKLGMNTQPTAPLVNGGTLAVQPKVNVQDQYGNTTSSTAMVTATADSTIWNLNGTTSVAASAGVTTFVGLTASSVAAVSSAKIIFSSPGLTSVTSNIFAIPAPAPANDSCAGAVILTANTGAILGTLVSSTPTTGSTYKDVYYSFTPIITGSFTITINNFSAAGDKDLYVYNTCPGTYITSGASFVVKATTSLTTSETVTATLTAGTTYKIMVQDYDAVGGTFNIAITGPAAYFSKSSGNLNILSSWGSNSDGSGNEPTSFTSANQTFVIKNNPTPTIDTSWIVSGTGSKVILGDSISSINFTIPDGLIYTGTLDIASNATLTLLSTNNSTITFGKLASGSVVDFASTTSQTIPAANYWNLSNSGNGKRTLASTGTIGIAGNYTPTTDSVTTTGSTINFNGTIAQTIPASSYNNITTSNASGCTTNGNVTFGNILNVSQPLTIGNGSTLMMLPGDSVIIAAGKNLTVSAVGKIQNNSTRAFNFNSTGTMTVNGVYVHNANSQTIPSSTYTLYATGSIIKVGNGDSNITTVNPILPANAYDVIWNCPAQTQTNIFISSTPTNLHDLTIVNTGSGYIADGLTSTARTLNISGNLNLQGGNLHVIGNGTNTADQTLNISGNLVVSGGKLNLNSGLSTSNSFVNLSGNLIHNGGIITASNSSTGRGTFVFRGTAPQATDSIGLSSLINVTVNNLLGVTLSNDLTVSGTLTFTSGKITTGANKLISTGTIAGGGSGGWVVGNLQKNISSIGSRTFEIGGTNYYRPVNINVTTLDTAGVLTVSVSQQDNNHPDLASSTISANKSIKRYFTLIPGNGLSALYDAVFNFNVADQPAGGSDSSKLFVGNYYGSNWSYPNVGISTAKSIQILGSRQFGDFAIGEKNSPVVVALAADSITPSSARLNGTINDNGFESTGAFDYGTSIGYGNSVTSNPQVVSANTGVTGVSANITSLTPNTQYFFRINANYSNGTTNSSSRSFYTLASVPGAPAVNTPTQTTLNVTLVTNGNPSNTLFAIHETSTNQYVQANGSMGSSPLWQTVSVWGTKTVIGLASNTTYTFEVRAQNGDSVLTAFGPAASGTTASNLPTDTIIAKWTFEGISIASTANTGTSPLLSLGNAFADTGSQTSGSSFSALHAGSLTTWSTPAGNGSSKSILSNTWAAGDYYQFKVNTTNYSNIKVSFDMTGSNTGPSTFKLQYSTDGLTFTNFGNNATLTNDGWSPSGPHKSASLKSFDFSGIASLNNQAALYFRVVNVNTISISGSTVAAGGTNRIDNFTVKGTVNNVVNNITQLNVKAYLQGYYIGQGSMNAGLYNIDNTLSSTSSDSVTINLWAPDATSLNNSTANYSARCLLQSNGSMSLTLNDSMVGKSYYIAIKHRNSIETWSANPILISSTTNYDFTDNANKAYGDGVNPPLIYVGNGEYAFYSGDVNQDGTADATDLQVAENDAYNFLFGYNLSDCNGDGASDAADMQTIENNANLFLFTARPH